MVPVPQQLRIADLLRGGERIAVVAGAGELDDPELHLRIS
jgi:hypothetical protein